MLLESLGDGMDDAEKAERILRGECLECKQVDGHTVTCSHNIWHKLSLKLDHVTMRVEGYQQEARDWAKKHPEEVEKWIEEYKKNV